MAKEKLGINEQFFGNLKLVIKTNVIRLGQVKSGKMKSGQISSIGGGDADVDQVRKISFRWHSFRSLSFQMICCTTCTCG
jgi:hypothetical protein